MTEGIDPMIAEREKQAMFYDSLFATFEQFRVENPISQASAIGALEMFKHDLLANWREDLE